MVPAQRVLGHIQVVVEGEVPAARSLDVMPNIIQKFVLPLAGPIESVLTRQCQWTGAHVFTTRSVGKASGSILGPTMVQSLLTPDRRVLASGRPAWAKFK